MQPGWSEEIWLSKVPNSDEHIIADETGRTMKTGSISMKPDKDSWNAEKVIAIKVFPNGMNEETEPKRDWINTPGSSESTGGRRVRQEDDGD